MSWRRQERPNGAWETSRKKGLYRRLTLRRADGQVYLNRWGISHDRIGGILLHKMEAPDPGEDLHDHPWWFVSIILWGGYVEERADTRIASQRAKEVEDFPSTERGEVLMRIAQGFDVPPQVCGAPRRGAPVRRGVFSAKVMRLNECHTIYRLLRKTSWSLVVKGPRRPGGLWGFFMPDGWLKEKEYDETVRADRRDLWSDQNEARPW